EKGDDTGLPDFGKEIATVSEHQYGPLLFLSGGSQNGAFGAGFLDGWNIARGLPEFSIVTGVSTGGLQATGAFIRNTELTIAGYEIDKESDILETYVSGVDVHGKDGKGGNVSSQAIVTALRKGAFSDLTPLRGRLDRLLTPEVLDEVGQGYNSGRRLYVAATDVDLGSAVAFDLSELANRYRQIRSQPEKTAADEKRMKKLKSCYIDALLASAIVPPGARPVFIDNRMYIDGGVHYAAFADDIGEMLADRTEDKILPRTSAYEAPRDVYLLLNGDGAIDTQCEKINQDSDCSLASSINGARDKWNLAELGFRSLSMLTKQVQRLSLERAFAKGRQNATRAHFARIRAEDMDEDTFPLPSADFHEQPCNGWKRIDWETDQPLEFYPRYMHCLIYYGRMRGREFDWDAVRLFSGDPKTGPITPSIEVEPPPVVVPVR
ncbi:MAG: patatin-like phospholipase family protein, partial [Sphingomonadaceae bacterium]